VDLVISLVRAWAEAGLVLTATLLAGNEDVRPNAEPRRGRSAPLRQWTAAANACTRRLRL